MTDLEFAKQERDKAEARLKSVRENGKLTADLIPAAEANFNAAIRREIHAMVAAEKTYFEREREKKKAEQHTAWLASCQQ